MSKIKVESIEGSTLHTEVKYSDGVVGKFHGIACGPGHGFEDFKYFNLSKDEEDIFHLNSRTTFEGNAPHDHKVMQIPGSLGQKEAAKYWELAIKYIKQNNIHDYWPYLLITVVGIVELRKLKMAQFEVIPISNFD